jgi:hypothetical protein
MRHDEQRHSILADDPHDVRPRVVHTGIADGNARSTGSSLPVEEGSATTMAAPTHLLVLEGSLLVEPPRSAAQSKI